MRPVIAITSGRREEPPGEGPRVRPGRVQVVLDEVLVARLRQAGAVVVILPPGDVGAVDELGPELDGVVLSGGAFDIDPAHYGASRRARIDGVDEDRTGLELALVRRARASELPLLGICGGMQAIAVALGGTLVQDLATERPGSLEHEQPNDPAEPSHELVVDPDWVDLLPDQVNSTHHQAVDEPGPLQVVARAPDGVIEAVCLPGHPFLVGVQWHPELLDGRLTDALVAAARRGRSSRP